MVFYILRIATGLLDGPLTDKLPGCSLINFVSLFPKFSFRAAFPARADFNGNGQVNG